MSRVTIRRALSHWYVLNLSLNLFIVKGNLNTHVVLFFSFLNWHIQYIKEKNIIGLTQQALKTIARVTISSIVKVDWSIYIYQRSGWHCLFNFPWAHHRIRAVKVVVVGESTQVHAPEAKTSRDINLPRRIYLPRLISWGLAVNLSGDLLTNSATRSTETNTICFSSPPTPFLRPLNMVFTVIGFCDIFNNINNCLKNINILIGVWKQNNNNKNVFFFFIFLLSRLLHQQKQKEREGEEKKCRCKSATKNALE